jgi:hypothetical protein
MGGAEFTAEARRSAERRGCQRKEIKGERRGDQREEW